MRGGLCPRGKITCVIDGITTCIDPDETCYEAEDVYAAVAPRRPPHRPAPHTNYDPSTGEFDEIF
jgi:hypothetical protein